MDNVEGKRISLKRRRPNPVFEDWLEELLTEAKAKKSRLEPMLQTALNSLSKYPLTLQTGADCAILKGFDRRLCAFLDKRLEVYNSINPSLLDKRLKLYNSNDPQPFQSSATDSCYGDSNDKKSSQTDHDDVHSNSSSTKSNKNSKVRKYKPAFRSGSYAVLVALLEHYKTNKNHPSLHKDQLIEIAQRHCEESFTRPKPETFYTAWSNMSRLVTKELVKKQLHNKKVEYSLTEQGVSLAMELLEDSNNTPTANDIIFNNASTLGNDIDTVQGNKQPGYDLDTVQENKQPMDNETVDNQIVLPQRTASEIKFTYLSAGSFDVMLLIDKQEAGGASKKNHPTVAQFAKYPDLKREYRSLKVGDFTWIARHKIHKDQELVLPYVVERKRMDDLGSSIKDGRFHEQKFRLRKCGLQNVIYLIENYGSNSHVGLPIQSLMQALANTRVQDGFKVHVTDSLTDSVKFLAMMTKRLTIEYKDNSLIGCNRESEGEELMTFNFFNKSTMKNKPLTVTETFIKLLLQLKGVSVEKALAITRVYSTPRLLIKEYEKCDAKQGETLLANLKYSELTQNVGPRISKAVYQLLTRQ